jgi:hypothetical protein
MPLISISRDDDNLARLFLCVQAVMCEPSDENSIQSWLALGSAGPSKLRSEMVANRLRYAHDRGVPAGLVFLNYLRLTIHCPEHGSIRKAQFLSSKCLSVDKTKRAMPFVTTVKALRECWSEFQPVAHFWASLYLLEHSDGLKPRNDSDAREFAKVLITSSDYLLHLAEEAKLHYPDPWKVADPRLLNLPPNPLLGPPTDWELKILEEEYKKR